MSAAGNAAPSLTRQKAMSSVPRCPQCGTSCLPDDAFCGNCGYLYGRSVLEPGRAFRTKPVTAPPPLNSVAPVRGAFATGKNGKSVIVAGSALAVIVLFCIISVISQRLRSDSSYNTYSSPSPAYSSSPGYYPTTNSYPSAPATPTPVPQYPPPNTSLPLPPDNLGPSPGTQQTAYAPPSLAPTTLPSNTHAPSSASRYDTNSSDQAADRQAQVTQEAMDRAQREHQASGDRQQVEEKSRMLRVQQQRADLEKDIAIKEHNKADSADTPGDIEGYNNDIQRDQEQLAGIDRQIAGQ